MRTIDADALTETLEKIPAAELKNIDGQTYVLVRLAQVFNVIKIQPTIEPERKDCADCKHGRFGSKECYQCMWAYADRYEADVIGG